MILFENAAILDTRKGALIEGGSVMVEGGVIREVAQDGRKISSATARVIDCEGQTLMPGLIDCHVHVTAGENSLGDNALLPDSLIAARAVRTLEQTLARGFTTVRDAGGANLGLVQALDEGTITGPRLVICGQALSQTCGHADMRAATDWRPTGYYTGRLGAIGRICDGEAEVRRACREEMKGGAKFIKVMANGGVASPNDPIDFLQFSRAELAAIVEEAENARTYVAAHLYHDEAIRRAVELGIHSVEHCNLVSDETAALMKVKGAVAVPTLITLEACAEAGREIGLPDLLMRKAEVVRDAAYNALDVLDRAGVTTVFGTDITVLGLMPRQNEEFAFRSRVLSADKIIRSATIDAAKLLRMEGQIGEITEDAFADLLLLRGNPLADVTLLADPKKNFTKIVRAGEVVLG